MTWSPLPCCISPGDAGLTTVSLSRGSTSTSLRQSSLPGWRLSHPNCLHTPLMFGCPAGAELSCPSDLTERILLQTKLLRALSSLYGTSSCQGTMALLCKPPDRMLSILAETHPILWKGLDSLTPDFSHSTWQAGLSTKLIPPLLPLIRGMVLRMIDSFWPEIS